MKLKPYVVGACCVVALLLTVRLGASGRIGVYGIVEKVVFEPNEQAAERLQVWGAFAYADGGPTGAASAAKRGYLYFSLPSVDPAIAKTIRTEWADLKSVAGTGQAVGFGAWIYIGQFAAPMGVYPLRGGSAVDLRIRPANEAPASPAPYETNTGVVKLSETGSHQDIVKQLRDALR
jgi:hypothetical protein